MRQALLFNPSCSGSDGHPPWQAQMSLRHGPQGEQVLVPPGLQTCKGGKGSWPEALSSIKSFIFGASYSFLGLTVSGFCFFIVISFLESESLNATFAKEGGLYRNPWPQISSPPLIGSGLLREFVNCIPKIFPQAKVHVIARNSMAKLGAKLKGFVGFLDIVVI